jgi:hypothetical protein
MNRNSKPCLLGLLAVLLASWTSGTQAAELSITVSAVATVNSQDQSQHGILAKFDLPSKLKGCTIDLAEMYFVVSPDASVSDLIACPMKTSWTAETASWSAVANQLNDSLVTSGVVNKEADETPRLNLTHIVQSWVDGSLSNYGLMITALEDRSNSISFEHYPGASAEVKAVVRIYYTAPKRK